MTAATAAGPRLHTVPLDYWDEQTFDEAHDAVAPLRSAETALKDVNWTADRLVRDVWGLTYSPMATVAGDVDPAAAVNQAFCRELEQSDELASVRQHTLNDPNGAAFAVASMLPYMEKSLRRLQDLQEQADEAQRKLDEARQAQDDQAAGGSGAEPGDGEGDGSPSPGGAGLSDEEVQALVDAADAAREQLDKAIDEQTPSIAKTMREAAGAAAAQADNDNATAAAWGLEPGELAELDPTDRMKFLAEMNTPELRRVAELFGTMRNESRGQRDKSFAHVPEEVYDVELSDNLERLLPSELLGLVMEEFSDDFFERYADRKLLCYKLRGITRATKGAIVCLLDDSVSMSWHGGDRRRWAQAFGLALLGIAKDQGRAFTAIVFGGVGRYQVFDFPEPAAFTPMALLAFATFGLRDAGTDFAGPLDAALELLSAQFANRGRTDADIVLATDGDCDVSDEWLAAFHAERERVGTNVYGLVIHGRSDTLAKIANKGVGRVESLVDGTDVRHVFTAVGL